MIEEGQEKFSGPVLARQARALERLKDFHSLNIARLNQAQSALQDFKNTVQQKQAEWQIALAIDDATRALDPNAAETLIQDLLADTALRTVQDRFNNVFAELDVQLNSMDAPTRDFLDRGSRTRMEALTLPTQVVSRSRT
jgi:glycine cleavage system regulatory protein